MLPNILDVVKSYGFEHSEPQKDGQVRISCPSKKTTELVCIINPEKNVYFCNCCKTGGGVKKLKNVLSNKKTKIYGAATLNRKQLSKIGWERLKSSNVDFYKEHHRKIWSDWLDYKNERLEKFYALFLISVHLEDKSLGAKIYEFLYDSIQDAEIPKLDMQLLIEALTMDSKKSKWMLNGEDIARKAILKCREFGDMKNTVAAMLIIYDFHHNTEQINPSEQFLFYSTKKFTPDYEDFFHWEKYMYNTLVYSFALVLLMLEEEDEIVQTEIYKKCHLFIERSLIKIDMSLLFDQYSMEDLYREDWAREGTRLARIAWREAGNRAKHEFLNALFINVKYLKPFIQKTYIKGEKAV